MIISNTLFYEKKIVIFSYMNRVSIKRGDLLSLVKVFYYKKK